MGRPLFSAPQRTIYRELFAPFLPVTERGEERARAPRLWSGDERLKSRVFPGLCILDTPGIGLYKPPTFRQAVSFQHPMARLAPRSKKLKRCL